MLFLITEEDGEIWKKTLVEHLPPILILHVDRLKFVSLFIFFAWLYTIFTVYFINLVIVHDYEIEIIFLFQDDRYRLVKNRELVQCPKILDMKKFCQSADNVWKNIRITINT